MNHKITILLRVAASMLVPLLLAGCASAPNPLFANYQAQGKIHLKVAVNTTDQLRATQNDKWKIPIGAFVATNVLGLAQQVFDGVVETQYGQPPTVPVAAILTPKIAYFTRTQGASGGGESIVDIKLEWTLTDPNGNTIWVDTIDGRSSATTRTNPKKVTMQALDNVLLKSQQAMSAAPAIRDYARKSST